MQFWIRGNIPFLEYRTLYLNPSNNTLTNLMIHLFSDSTNKSDTRKTKDIITQFLSY